MRGIRGARREGRRRGNKMAVTESCSCDGTCWRGEGTMPREEEFGFKEISVSGNDKHDW